MWKLWDGTGRNNKLHKLYVYTYVDLAILLFNIWSSTELNLKKNVSFASWND